MGTLPLLLPLQVVMRQFPVGPPGSPTGRAVSLPYAVLEVKLVDREAPQPPWLMVSPALLPDFRPRHPGSAYLFPYAL